MLCLLSPAARRYVRLFLYTLNITEFDAMWTLYLTVSIMCFICLWSCQSIHSAHRINDLSSDSYEISTLVIPYVNLFPAYGNVYITYTKADM